MYNAKMETSVVSLGSCCTRLQFLVAEDESVLSLKNKISVGTGVAVDDQRIFLAGKQLEQDGHPLRRYNVSPGCVFHLLKFIRGGVQLFVRYNATTVTLEVQQSDTVEEIKEKLQDALRVPSLFLGLVFGGVEMSDNHTLSDYNIQKESVLHAVKRKTVIMVDDVGRQESHRVNVKSTHTVAKIKAMLKEKLSVADSTAGASSGASSNVSSKGAGLMDQEYVLIARTPPSNKMAVLKDSMTLAECGISKETTFEIVPQPERKSSRVLDYLQQFSATLKGVQSLVEHCFSFTSEKSLDIDLDEFGIRFHIPEGAVPHGNEAYIAVIPLVGGTFGFPHGYRPVGGMYAVGVSCTLNKPITVEIQHSVRINGGQNASSNLRFAHANHHQTISPPYKFEWHANKGEFRAGSDYGVLETSSFSIMTILSSIYSWFMSPLPTVDVYKASLLYKKCKDVHRKWIVHFFVTRNLNEHLQALKQKVPDLAYKSETVFDFAKSPNNDEREEHITLDIPAHVETNGWLIKLHQHPCKIKRSHVDQFGYSLSDLPVCNIDLKATLNCSGSLHYRVGLNGVADTDQVLFLSCDLDGTEEEGSLTKATDRQDSGTFSRQILTDSPSSSYTTGGFVHVSPTSALPSTIIADPDKYLFSSKPTLKDLVNLVGSRVGNSFKSIGIGLNIDLPKVEEILKQNQSHIQEGFVDLFDVWLKSTPTASWRDIVRLLKSESINRPDVVDSLRRWLKEHHNS